ncbi:Abi family protein [Halorhodospira halophila]|nr:Abi family protein [Halorhodospira halophila]
MEFGKPATTVDEQIQILRQRGMQIDDVDRARHYLQHINYYRLTAYWLPFEEDYSTHQFRSGARFEDALNLYIFDREFRLLLLDAIERIEISVRTQWAYYLALTYGAHSYLEPTHAVRADWHTQNLAALREEVGRSKELFIRHYSAKYSTPAMPPVWSVCEVMSLGLLSRWITQLRPADRKRIAAVYGLDQRTFQGFIRHLTYVRNLCAHHSRVWNRSLTVTMELPKKKPVRLLRHLHYQAKREIYNTLVMQAYFLDQISPRHHWRERLLALIDVHDVDPARMGFPDGWRLDLFWATAQGDWGGHSSGKPSGKEDT